MEIDQENQEHNNKFGDILSIRKGELHDILYPYEVEITFLL